MAWDGKQWVPGERPPVDTLPPKAAKKPLSVGRLIVVLILCGVVFFLAYSCTQAIDTTRRGAVPCPTTSAELGDLSGAFADGFNRGANGCP
jgi:hypothetical protein